MSEAGKMAGIRLRSHDLRRHSATFASRSGTPIEIVSKVISDMPIHPRFTTTSGKSATLRQWDGLKTYMAKFAGVNPCAGFRVEAPVTRRSPHRPVLEEFHSYGSSVYKRTQHHRSACVQPERRHSFWRIIPPSAGLPRRGL
jgi:hypothetical protein